MRIEKYYSIINYDEYKKLIHQDIEEFSKYELETITKMMSSVTSVKTTHRGTNRNGKNDTIHFVIPSFAQTKTYYIVKTTDEWYIVFIYSTPNRIYKCDQFEGLIKFIKNNIFSQKYIKEYNSYFQKLTLPESVEYKDNDFFYQIDHAECIINFVQIWKGNTHKYYMCDQLDGLVIFLNDNMGKEVDKKLSENKSSLYFPSSKILESNTKYYRHINKEEFTKLKSNKKLLFNEKEISLLNSINTDFKIRCDNNVRYVSIEVMPFIVFINKDLNEAIYIYKLDDEWYSIAWKVIEKNISSYNFYKCDQLDGLIMFLNDKIGIKRPKSINESTNQNEYKPITINEADTYLSSKVVDINLSNKQLEIIYNFFSDIEMIKMPNYLNYINYVYINFQHNIIKIFEIEDEWFIVSVESPANSLRPMGKISLFWKCDQFSGLIQFLNDYKSPFYNLHRMRESINNDMYKPISKEPYNSIDIKKRISIDDRTFSAIDKLTQGTWGINCNKKKEIHSDGTKLTHAEIYKHIKQGKYTIKVRQHEDDWYIVSIFYESYSEDRIIEIYKCDQLDGLIKCLKDILCNI